MPSVCKDAFRRPLRRNVEKYPLPEYGADAYVQIQALTARDIQCLQEAYGRSPDTGNLDFVNELLSRTLIDDGGTPIFDSPAEVADYLASFSLPALEHLVEAVLRISGIDSKRTAEKN